MNRSPRAARLFALLALTAALGLGACGKKGPLDAPPMSMAPVAPAETAGPPGSERQLYDAEGNPVTPRGERKPFVLDWLLN